MEYRHYLSEKTISYLNQQFPQETPVWMEAFDSELDRLAQKWDLTITGCENKAAWFGVILYGESGLYGKVAVKIVPRFCSRLRTEIYCYRNLPYRELCPLYDVDESLGAMLLKYVEQDPVRDPERLQSLFPRLSEQRRADDGKSILPRFEDVLTDVLGNARNVISRSDDPRLHAFEPSIARALSGMERFRGRERCLIHGDAHEFNLLEGDGEVFMIDPLGYAAPFSFEYARYLGTAMKFDPLTDEAMSAILGRMLPKGEDLRDVLTAYAIDTTLRGCNTFIEGNTYEEICFGADWARRAWAYADALLR